jgi:hypothetical protein
MSGPGLMTTDGEEERKLKMDQMRADIDNKQADTRYKIRLERLEPWKVIITAVGVVAVLFGVLGGLVGYKVGSAPPPAPIIIQVPAPPPPAVRG